MRKCRGTSCCYWGEALRWPTEVRCAPSTRFRQPFISVRNSVTVERLTTLIALQKSGLSTWLGQSLVPLQSIPPAAISILLCLLVAMFTECSSNTATTTLFLPILASMVRGNQGKKISVAKATKIPTRH